ncbi:GTP-binding protein Di-Ras2-like [Mytilus trossulus]|uniref:GTP-binding protein Di-Ras2-like n=1 Tax=Mytilus trossulus TaxID=6551 RepID=UPI0030050B89
MNERPKVAFLGAGGVGKSSILQRFMFGTFQESYIETVEEIYSYQFNESGKRLNINLLDTAGNIQFPAMRQLYISKAQAFVLVYSIKDEASFSEVKTLWERIKQVRPNILDIPCVIIGNNLDQENDRQVETFDALNWACSENLGGCFVETSAKENKGIQEAFSLLLEQFLTRRHEDKGPLKLRSLSLHKLHLEIDVPVLFHKHSDKSKGLQKATLRGKSCTALRQSACMGNNQINKTEVMDKCSDIDGKLKRSRTDGVLEICKSQGRRKLHLF